MVIKLNFARKHRLLLLLILIASQTSALAQRDTQEIRSLKRPALINRSISAGPCISKGNIQFVKMAIADTLNSILSKYKSEPDNAVTWSRIRYEMDNYFLNLFLRGCLAGSRSADAYYVKIGLNTMNAADIAAGRKVVVAGYALLKPGEFEVVRVQQ